MKTCDFQSKTIAEFFTHASPAAVKEANRRYAILAPCLEGGSPKQANVPVRTARRWLRRWQEAVEAYGCGYLGLLPRQHQKGNRKRKLPPHILALLDDFVIRHKRILQNSSRMEAYAVFVQLCRERAAVVPSYKTFLREIRRRSLP